MTDITKEITELANELEVATTSDIDLVKAQILELGPEGLKNAAKDMSDEQREILAEVLDDMRKSSYTTEPVSDTTPEGDQVKNQAKIDGYQQDFQDEKVEDDAEKKKQFEHRNQGGVPVEGWTGQLIKSAVERMIERDLDRDTCVNKLAKAADVKADVLDELWGLLEKAHSYKYDDGTTGTDIPEADQVDMPKEMKTEEKAKKGKPEDRGGDSKTTADEGENPPTTIKKSSGEGSRGGKVIGHTKSGKPIYAKPNKDNTSDYAKDDHNDAFNFHADYQEDQEAKYQELTRKIDQSVKWKPELVIDQKNADFHDQNRRILNDGRLFHLRAMSDKKPKKPKKTGPVPSLMDMFGIKKSQDPFKENTFGKNTHYDVDAYLAAEYIEGMKKSSTFDYEDDCYYLEDADFEKAFDIAESLEDAIDILEKGYRTKQLPGGGRIYAEGPNMGKRVGSIRGKGGMTQSALRTKAKAKAAKRGISMRTKKQMSPKEHMAQANYHHNKTMEESQAGKIGVHAQKMNEHLKAAGHDMTAWHKKRNELSTKKYESRKNRTADANEHAKNYKEHLDSHPAQTGKLPESKKEPAKKKDDKKASKFDMDTLHNYLGSWSNSRSQAKNDPYHKERQKEHYENAQTHAKESGISDKEFKDAVSQHRGADKKADKNYRDLKNEAKNKTSFDHTADHEAEYNKHNMAIRDADMKVLTATPGNAKDKAAKQAAKIKEKHGDARDYHKAQHEFHTEISNTTPEERADLKSAAKAAMSSSLVGSSDGILGDLKNVGNRSNSPEHKYNSAFHDAIDAYDKGDKNGFHKHAETVIDHMKQSQAKKIKKSNDINDLIEKSFDINDMLEKGLDMDDLVLNQAMTNNIAEESGAYLVKSFSDEDFDTLDTVDNLWETEDNLEKAEGSRGGKVIGHTRSGKPIYASAHSTESYDKNDHTDAASVHHNMRDRYTKDRGSKKGAQLARDSHLEHAQIHEHKGHSMSQNSLKRHALEHGLMATDDSTADGRRSAAKQARQSTGAKRENKTETSEERWAKENKKKLDASKKFLGES